MNYPIDNTPAEQIREWASYLGIVRDVCEKLQAAALAAADGLEGVSPNPLASVSPIRPSSDPRTPGNVAIFERVHAADGAELIITGTPQRNCHVEAVVVDAPTDAVVTEVRVGRTIAWEGRVSAMSPVRFASSACQMGQSIQIMIQNPGAPGDVSAIAVGLHDLH